MLSKEFHASRRAKYLELLEERSVGFVFSGEMKYGNGDEEIPFIPYANFYYLTGFEYPKAVYMAAKINGHVREMLFIDHPNEMAKRWQGVFYTKESVSEETGIDCVEYIESFDEFIPMFRAPGMVDSVYFDIASWEGGDSSSSPEQRFARKVRDFDPTLNIRNTYNGMSLIRQVEEPEEIEMHRKACEITTEGVKCILAHLHPNMYEYEIEAWFDHALKARNAGHAFATIAASSINACSMHYADNDRLMEDGEMILFDLGAEWGHYASDVSRTFPVNGKFTDQQKMLYNVVLKGLEAAEAAAKPGVIKSSLQDLSREVMAEELVKTGMIEKAEEIDQFYFHGSGHYIGLYTHDVGNDDAPLEENMMFTLEPGLYFDDLKLGIRIEDTLLVTKDGVDILSGEIPKTIDEIEGYMAIHNENDFAF